MHFYFSVNHHHSQVSVNSKVNVRALFQFLKYKNLVVLQHFFFSCCLWSLIYAPKYPFSWLLCAGLLSVLLVLFFLLF